jgi:RecG-like helicase
VLLSGKPKYEGLVWQMHHPRVETLDAEEEEPLGLILPVYPLTEGLQQWHVRKIVRGVMNTWLVREGGSRLIAQSPANPRSCRRFTSPLKRIPAEEGYSIRNSSLHRAGHRRQQHDQSAAAGGDGKIDARYRSFSSS